MWSNERLVEGDDWEVSEAMRVNLKAQRAGGGSGRIYNIEVQCRDHAGNRSRLFPVSVTVPHDQRNRRR